jgi:hypothetical protein
VTEDKSLGGVYRYTDRMVAVMNALFVSFFDSLTKANLFAPLAVM